VDSKYGEYCSAHDDTTTLIGAFPTKNGTPLSMDNLYKAEIAPTINRCAVCHRSEQDHQSKKRKPEDGQQYVRDQSLPEWKGWHAFRRGLATNLTDLGVRPEVIQRILRHGDLATTMRYVKTRAHRINDAMATLEAAVPAQPVLRDTFGTLNNKTGARPVAVN